MYCARAQHKFHFEIKSRALEKVRLKYCTRRHIYFVYTCFIYTSLSMAVRVPNRLGTKKQQQH